MLLGCALVSELGIAAERSALGRVSYVVLSSRKITTLMDIRKRRAPSEAYAHKSKTGRRAYVYVCIDVVGVYVGSQQPERSKVLDRWPDL